MYRSRLQRVEERRNIKRAAWLALGTILVLAALIMWGVPVMVKLAVFLGNINSSRKPIDRSDLIPPAPPTIRVLHEATNSARQVISGWAEPGATVVLTMNSQSLGSVVAKDDGEFAFPEVFLKKGKNDFVAVAIDGGGNKSLESLPVSIHYWNVEPKLEVTSPTEGQKIQGGEANIEVNGQTDPGLRLVVNGKVVIVSASGSFTARVNLTPGENLIVAEASDRAGNVAKKEIRVIYSP